MKKIFFMVAGLIMATSASANTELWGDDPLKQTAVELLMRGTVGGDTDFIRANLAEDYIQHNPHVPDGRDAVISFVEALHAEDGDITGQSVRALRDGDLVLVHSRASLNGADLVFFDLFRFEDGIAVEHWDVVQPHPAETASGRSMVDGATEITDLERTEENRALVADFVKSVVVGQDFSRVSEFLSDPYIQHNPKIGDNMDGLVTYAQNLADQGITFSYDTVHRVIAEGNFVLAQSEGTFNGAPTAFYDLYRVEDGKIVEHWDVIQEIPEHAANDNGMF